MTVDLSDGDGRFDHRWINLDEGEWESAEQIEGGEMIEITTPEEGHWVAIIAKDQ